MNPTTRMIESHWRRVIRTHREEFIHWGEILQNCDLDTARGRTVRDEFAEGMYCSMLADRLSEQGQTVPSRQQLEKIGARQVDLLPNLDSLDRTNK